MDLIHQFIDDMHKNGCAPKRQSDIKPTNKRTNYSLCDAKGNKKHGYYKLQIDGDFAFGFYGDYRLDNYFSWHSKSDKTYTKEQLEEFKHKAEVDRKAAEDETKRIHSQKAIETQEFLMFLDEAQSHPYLTKKQIEPCGTLISGENLIIPMCIGDEQWNYQRIKEDGEKLFYAGAKLSGTYYKINGAGDTVYICEGFATGATVHMVTGATVYVAFNAGNIGHVVKLLKGRHNNIVIAADNDHETIINKKKYNTGIEKAKSTGLPYAFPVFKDGRGLSDFNDLYIAEGKEAVIKCLQDTQSVPAKAAGDDVKLAITSSTAPAVNWEDQFIRNKNGIVPTSTINATLVMQNDPALRGIFCYDSFAKRLLLRKCPPWANENEFEVRGIQDHDYLPLECYLERTYGIRAAKNKCADLVEAVAHEKHNVINPACEYFSALEWDGIDRLENWLIDYVTDGEQNHEYLRIVGKKFMCGLAARAMQPGIKFDTMIIFEGEQYAGKSYLSRIMATIGDEEYFLDDFKDIENKDALMKMQGKLVVEFPEISTMRKAEVNDLKAFISRQDDEFRPPYGRNTINAPRQCVFIGTVNPEGHYLRDVTGNRRYWPVSCRKKLPIEDLRDVMPMLHAEAAHLVREGEQLWLAPDEYEVAKIEQAKRVMEDMWTDKIEELVQHAHEITTDEICLTLSLPSEKQSPLVYSRISQIMTSLGFVPARISQGSKRVRGYKKIINKNDF